MREIEWSASRTGLINPVAIFDPVELEGTTVSRASVHNVSIVEQMQLGIGDTITVYKANMIIPQIAENLTRSGQMVIPDTCPVCGGATRIRQEADVRTLYCTNPDCQAKHIKKYALMAERDALNIEGLSEMTLEKFVGEGMIHEYRDVFRLGDHRENIVNMEGFGVKSFDNLMDSLEKARKTTMAKFLYTLGIPGVGLSYAKVICRNFPGEDCYEKIKKAKPEELTAIEGIGPVLAQAVRDYFADEKKREEADRLFECLSVEMPISAVDAGAAGAALPLAGMTFVITGSLKNFENRSLMKEYIERLGGKAADSVTSKTTALINNDITSGSGKNKKAKELGVEIITEEEFLRRAQHAD